MSQVARRFHATDSPRITSRQLIWRRVSSSPSSRTVKILVFAGSTVLLVAIAWLAHLKGPDLRLALYYPVPALVVAWFIGRRPGYAMAAITTAVWFAADLHSTVRYSRPDYLFLNTATRLLTLSFGAYLLSSVKDLTTQMAELVEQRTRALRDLSIRLSQAEESERSRLARDLHDGLGQSLTLLKLNLTAAVAESASGNFAANRLNDAVSLVSNLIERSRDLTFDLHPTMLDTLGLVPTLRHYAEQFARQTHIDVIVNEEGTPAPLSSGLSSYLFRSAKELITNAAKHGPARQIIVSLFWNADSLRVIVDDDGNGFDPEAVLAGGVNTGIGLAGIRERINALDGSVRIESGKSGSRIVVDVPRETKE
jgi:signal transduction histidine kinase